MTNYWKMLQICKKLVNKFHIIEDDEIIEECMRIWSMRVLEGKDLVFPYAVDSFLRCRKNMTDEELEKAIQQALENEFQTGNGARAVEEYFAGPYKEQWYQVWIEGRLAQKQGKSKNENPHKLKVWQAVWEYGWDNYDPNKQFYEFAKVEEHLKTLPMRSLNENDL